MANDSVDTLEWEAMTTRPSTKIRGAVGLALFSPFILFKLPDDKTENPTFVWTIVAIFGAVFLYMLWWVLHDLRCRWDVTTP
jgi:hypothetical protein